MEKPDKCQLCGSEDDYLNFHHLIPRTVHSTRKFLKLFTKEYMKTNGVWICKAYCHRQIHRFITEKDMAMFYNTLQLLLEHPEVKKYVEWRSKRVNK